MAFDFTQGSKFLHGTSTVTHTHKTAGGNTADSVPYADKELVQIQEESGAWVLSSTDCTWHLPAGEMASAPEPGDTITDGTDVWTILDATREPLTNIWQCRCTKER